MHSPRNEKKPGGGGLLVNDEGRQSRLRKMQEERNKEYNDLMAKKVKEKTKQNQNYRLRVPFDILDV